MAYHLGKPGPGLRQALKVAGLNQLIASQPSPSR